MGRPIVNNYLLLQLFNGCLNRVAKYVFTNFQNVKEI